MNEIRQFSGKYHFLSNFYAAPITWGSVVWPTAEHAYQAAKTPNSTEQESIRQLKRPNDAKQAGKKVQLREDWEQIKVDVMRSICCAKFNQHPKLKQALLDTGDAILIEGNWWHDNFWGTCPVESDKGKNWLGRILMELREQFRLETLVG